MRLEIHRQLMNPIPVHAKSATPRHASARVPFCAAGHLRREAEIAGFIEAARIAATLDSLLVTSANRSSFSTCLHADISSR